MRILRTADGSGLRYIKTKAARALAVKLLPPSVFSGFAPPVFLNVAVTFGSVTGLRRARAFLLLRDRSISLFLVATNTQTQASNDVVVLLNIYPSQIIEQTPALLDHLQQPTPRMMIFLVRFEMLGEFGDALTKQRNLYLR
jgi:hypothetical protein